MPKKKLTGRFPEAGEEIRRRREALGWDKKHFAQMAGIARPTVYVLERGDETTPEVRKKAEDALTSEEQERRDAAYRFGLDAHNAIAAAVTELEDGVEAGTLTPGGMVLCLRVLADDYGEHIENMDPVAVEEAIQYASSVVRARMRTQAERN